MEDICKEKQFQFLIGIINLSCMYLMREKGGGFNSL